MVEQATVNRLVVGSNPPPGARDLYQKYSLVQISDTYITRGFEGPSTSARSGRAQARARETAAPGTPAGVDAKVREESPPEPEKRPSACWRFFLSQIPDVLYTVSMPRSVIVHDRMQPKYRYTCIAPIGKRFDPTFTPDLTPKQMLALGVFGGKYMTDCRNEFPADWFKKAKLSPLKRDASLNFFGVDASQPLAVWKKKGWIYPDDPRGWFQWYCRYYMGRRIPGYDDWQIKRWKAIRRS